MEANRNLNIFWLLVQDQSIIPLLFTPKQLAHRG